MWKRKSSSSSLLHKTEELDKQEDRKENSIPTAMVVYASVRERALSFFGASNGSSNSVSNGSSNSVSNGSSNDVSKDASSGSSNDVSSVSVVHEKKSTVLSVLKTPPCSSVVKTHTQANDVLSNYYHEPSQKVKDAVHLLFSLSDGDDWELRLLRTHTNLISRICTAIHYYEAMRDTLVSVLWLARNLARDNSMRANMIQQNTMRANMIQQNTMRANMNRQNHVIWHRVLSVLSLHKRDREVVAACISVLWNTADMVAVEKFKVDEAILSSLKRFRDDYWLVSLSCGAFQALAGTAKEIRDKMKKDGVGDVVMDIMQRFDGDENAVKGVCFFLRTLYQDGEEGNSSGVVTVDDVTNLVKKRHGDIFWFGNHDVLVSIAGLNQNTHV